MGLEIFRRCGRMSDTGTKSDCPQIPPSFNMFKKGSKNIFEMLPIPRLALSVGALYSVLGLSLSGFTLPIEAMPPYIQGLSVAFPLRHYYLFYVQEVLFGAGFAGWWKEVVWMLCFLFVPLFGLKRLKNAYIHQNFPKD